MAPIMQSFLRYMMPLALRNIMIIYLYPMTLLLPFIKKIYIYIYLLVDFWSGMHLWNACNFFIWKALFIQSVLTDNKMKKMYHTIQCKTVQKCTVAGVLNRQKHYVLNTWVALSWDSLGIALSSFSWELLVNCKQI